MTILECRTLGFKSCSRQILKTCMTLSTLNLGSYGIAVYLGHARCLVPTVLVFFAELKQSNTVLFMCSSEPEPLTLRAALKWSDTGNMPEAGRSPEAEGTKNAHT